jgi:Na+/proline symporter
MGPMKILDWLVLCTYFLVMLGMGFWARAKVKTASDFFTAGVRCPGGSPASRTICPSPCGHRRCCFLTS